MPTPRARYYQPWDPLQLSRAVDSGLRVKKNGVMFALCRARGRKILWTPLLHRHVLNFYGEREYVTELLEQMVKQTKKMSNESYTVDFYSVGSGDWPEVDELDESCKTLTYHPYDESAEHFLKQLQEHVSYLAEETAKLGVYEAPNKRIQVLVIAFSESEWDSIVDSPENLVMLEKLMKDSLGQRVYLWLFTPSGEAVPDFLLEQCTYGFFWGEANTELAEKYHFPDVETSEHSLGQKFLGVTWETGVAELVAVSPVKFTLSEYAQALTRRQQEEEELYRRFLATLDDGT